MIERAARIVWHFYANTSDDWEDESERVNMQGRYDLVGQFVDKGKGKVHPCTCIEVLYWPYGP
jgi:hypothetical protein